MLQIVGSANETDSAPQYETTFEELWLLYPRHVAKKDAIRAFDKVPKSEHVPMMIGLAAWRRVWLDRGEIEYVPHASTWLNGWRWEDELPPGYTLMPRVNGKSSAALPEPTGERIPMPEHVRAQIAKLREGRK